MIKFSQQPVTKQQKIVFAPNLNLEGYKIKSTLEYKIFSTLKRKKEGKSDSDIYNP